MYLAFKYLNIAIPAFLGLLCLFGVKNKPKKFEFFTLYFFYVSFGEAIGMFNDWYFGEESNILFYDTFFIPSLYLLQIAFFHQIIPDKAIRKLILVLGILFLVAIAMEKTLLKASKIEFSYFSYCIGAVIIILCCLFYFYMLIRSPAIIHFKTTPLFWICSGALFFQLFTFPFWALFDVWRVYTKIGNFYYVFSIVCNYIAYLFYTIGILCWKKR